jgi:hypothetical protein
VSMPEDTALRGMPLPSCRLVSAREAPLTLRGMLIPINPGVRLLTWPFPKSEQPTPEPSLLSRYLLGREGSQTWGQAPRAQEWSLWNPSPTFIPTQILLSVHETARSTAGRPPGACWLPFTFPN